MELKRECGGSMKRWGDGFAAVDWGSTARRAYVLGVDGHVVRQEEDAAGTLTIGKGGFAVEVDLLRARLGTVPLLLAGMVGSNRGWIEAPYVKCPATLTEIAAHLLWAEPGRSAIVPGVSLLEDGRADVMRGEEVQVIGAHLLERRRDRMVICHPGTHTKWVVVDGGAITSFRTVMTGELFALLKAHSIVSDLLTAVAVADAAFGRGVERGFAGAELGADLFGVRAGVLLGVAQRETSSSYVSGLLIGNDLRAGLRARPKNEDILVLGRGSLVTLYAAALRQCGYATREMDGGTAFVAGMRAIAETIA